VVKFQIETWVQKVFFVFVSAAAELTVNGQPFNGKPLTPWFSPVENRRYLRNL